MFTVIMTFLGLIVGSFLNVVICRLPLMLEKNWRQECSLLLGLSNPINAPNEALRAFNLFVPRSHCPQCKQTIRAKDNIPVLSYLILKGKCRSCERAIPIIYPFVEILSACLTGLVAYQFGFTAQGIAGMVFNCTFYD